MVNTHLCKIRCVCECVCVTTACRQISIFLTLTTIELEIFVVFSDDQLAAKFSMQKFTT